MDNSSQREREKLFEAASALGIAISEVVSGHIQRFTPQNASVPVEPLIGKNEVAAHLGIGMRTLNSWIARGYIPYYKFGRSVRFKLSDVQARLDERYRVGVTKGRL